ncbi:DNA-3-methyladenine glycosylase [Candidatus Dojkabacteria bacterium]|nr:DNA-3-methyladenine glycosylase [Candidatus Dojkabacteria bacterium]
MIPLSYYQQNDTLTLAKDLIGRRLFTCINGKITGGTIVETEAYIGPLDKASHAIDGRRTKRTEILFKSGGRAYAYLIYGLYTLFNVTTGKKDKPECILIRAIKPETGIETMKERRFGNYNSTKKVISDGPGRLTQALAIDKSMYGLPLNSEVLWIEEGIDLSSQIVATPRVGIDYAEEFADKKWRFVVPVPGT